MLHTLLAYARGLGFDARWSVLGGEPDFFTVTKRLHNHLYGFWRSRRSTESTIRRRPRRSG